MTFHDEVEFKTSIELQQESEAVQPASPSSENEESDDQREEPREGPSNEPLEPAEVLERTLEEPLAKRKPGWFKETVQEAKKLRLLSVVVTMNEVSGSNPRPTIVALDEIVEPHSMPPPG